MDAKRYYMDENSGIVDSEENWKSVNFEIGSLLPVYWAGRMWRAIEKECEGGPEKAEATKKD